MKLINPELPVRRAWFTELGQRLDASPYLSGAFEARKLLERTSLPSHELHTLTAGHAGGIYNGPQFRRVYVQDPEYGVPFLGSTDIMEADFTNLPLLSKKHAYSGKLAHLEVEPGMTLISCSGTVGRMCYVRPDMAGFWSSQHVMKVQPDAHMIPSGYLHAFLLSRFGSALISGSAYGSIIQHIEPRHLADLPVPRLDAATESHIHELIQGAAELRAQAQATLNSATRDLFDSAGLAELADLAWHQQPRDAGFSAPASQTTLRALNFSPRARAILDRLGSVSHRTLGDICQGGRLSSGNRFIRIDTDAGHGYCLIGQRQAPWVRPEGRWIALKPEELANVRVPDETSLIAAQGTLGENELYCRPIFVTGRWSRDFVFSQHFLRVISGDPEVPGAYLFALLRSEALFRVLRSLSAGSKQQDINSVLRQRIPVPLTTPADRERIVESVRQAYRWRDEADGREDEALDLLDRTIREAAR